MRRLLLSFGSATVLAIVFGLVQVAEVPVGGQSPATAWGHPDLEGIWLDVHDTPFERNPELGDREVATDEERQARDQARMVNPGRNERSGAAARDVAGAYNAVYTSAKPAGPRTSLVVDPPDGRIPALTAEAEQRNEMEQEWRLLLLQNTETCEVGAPGWRNLRAAVAAPFRRHPVLQHLADESARRPGGSERGRSVHARGNPGFQGTPSDRAGREFDRVGL